MTPTFALELQLADGSIEEIPVNLDHNTTTPDQKLLAFDLWDKTSPTDLAAAYIFARTNRPPDDWPVLGPVLRGLIEGDQTHLKVRD